MYCHALKAARHDSVSTSTSFGAAILSCRVQTNPMPFYFRVSNRSAGIISSRFPGDIFTKIQQNRICSFIDIYRAGSLTPVITLILLTQAIARTFTGE